MVQSKEIRLTVRALPDDIAGYPAYRYRLKQKIRKCGLGGAVTTRFSQELESLSKTWEFLITPPAHL